MNIITDFAALPCCDLRDKSREISRLYYQGADTEIFIPGLVLEKQVQVGKICALFMTYDCPFEEQLSILCLDSTLKIIDSATLIIPYAAGQFRTLSIQQPASLNFEFVGDGYWSVEFFDRPHSRLPLFSEPFGVWRPFGFHRWFRLSYHRPGPPP